MSALRELLTRGEPSFSFEFFPPKTEAGTRVLWDTIRRIEPLAPSFVSVTYGAGGSSRDRTMEVTKRIVDETTLQPVARLTAVGQSMAELRCIIGQYAEAGVRNVLALPATDSRQIARFAELSHATFPAGLARRLEEAQDNPAEGLRIGVDYATAMAGRLLEEGAPGPRYITLNRC